MPPEMKARWKKEIDWLLSVTDQIVEFAPSKQSKNGVTFEVSTLHTRLVFKLLQRLIFLIGTDNDN